MARFDLNQPIRTEESTIAVDAGLPIGPHLFRLEVIDSAGLRSEPSEVVVTVTRAATFPPLDPSRLDPRLPNPFRPR